MKVIPHSQSKGMTLVELLAVIIILSIMSAMAVLLFSHTGVWSLKAAAGELAGRIREARSSAIIEGRNINIIFYEFSRKYKLEYPDDGEWVSLPEGINYSANNFPLVIDNRPTLYFRHTGAPNRGGHIGLKDKRGNQVFVIVAPVTGRVRVDKAPP